MKHVQTIAVAASLCGITQQACAQAFNLDFGGSDLTMPSASYGAASGQQGFWELEGSNLRDITGSPTLVSIDTGGSGDSHEIPGAMTDDALLMESYLSFVPSSSYMALRNVQPGQYDCYIYSWLGTVLGSKTVNFRISNGLDQQFGAVTYNSLWPGGHVENETYIKVRVEVLSDLQVLGIIFSFSGDFNVINGLQLVPVPAPASALPLLALPLALAQRRR